MSAEKVNEKMEEANTEEQKMSKAINKANTEIAKLDTMNEYFLDRIGMNTHELNLLQSWYPGISAAEIWYAASFQKEAGLSLAKKEIWMVKRGASLEINGRKQWVEKYEPMTGIEGARKVSRLKAKEMSVEYRPVKTSYELQKTTQLQEKAGGLIEWNEVSDMMFTAEVEFNGQMEKYSVPFSQICQRKKDKGLTKFWKESPFHMGCKVVEFRLLKKLYGLSVPCAEDPMANMETQAEEGEFTVVNEQQGKKATKLLDKIKKDLPVKKEEKAPIKAEKKDLPVEQKKTTPEMVKEKVEEQKTDKEDEINCNFIDAAIKENGWSTETFLAFAVKKTAVVVSTFKEVMSSSDFKQFRADFASRKLIKEFIDFM